MDSKNILKKSLKSNTAALWLTFFSTKRAASPHYRETLFFCASPALSFVEVSSVLIFIRRRRIESWFMSYRKSVFFARLKQRSPCLSGFCERGKRASQMLASRMPFTENASRAKTVLISEICVKKNSVAKNLSAKNIKLCKTNPISKMLKML